MLSTLVQQQKHWTIPLMVSLALSWCLLFCSSVAMPLQADVAAANNVVAEQSATCHGKAPQPGEQQTAQHENCEGCNTQATQSDAMSLPVLILLVSWIDTNDIWPVNNSNKIWLAQAPFAKPSVPLYLRKNLLLI